MDATPIIEGMDKGWARVLPIKIPTQGGPSFASVPPFSDPGGIVFVIVRGGWCC